MSSEKHMGFYYKNIFLNECCFSKNQKSVTVVVRGIEFHVLNLVLEYNHRGRFFENFPRFAKFSATAVADLTATTGNPGGVWRMLVIFVWKIHRSCM